MGKEADDGSAQPDRAFTAAFALLVTALACSVVVLATPRLVRPSRLPALRLSSALVQAQKSRDQALLTRAAPLRRDREVVQLSELYREEGLVELEPQVDYRVLAQQRAERAELARRVFARLGDEGRRAFSALTVEDAMRALAGDRGSDQARGLLGAFPALLSRYGYADAAGHLVAPELSVRALYKARFNLIFDQPATHELSPIELQAYEGFNALQAGGLPPVRRAEAAAAFYRAGGTDAAEALAVWLFQGEQRADALSLLSAEYERTHALRLRNMALVARQPE
jgi:hypothetical protein